MISQRLSQILFFFFFFYHDMKHNCFVVKLLLVFTRLSPLSHVRECYIVKKDL